MMIIKTPLKSGRHSRVTFVVPPRDGIRRVRLVGEFNDWDREAPPLPRRKDGRFSTSLTLPRGERFRFRYLLDDQRWENEPEADSYEPNPFGSTDSVVEA